MRAKPYHLPQCDDPEKIVHTCLTRTEDHQCRHMLEIPAYGTLVSSDGKGDDWWPYGGEGVLEIAEAGMAVGT